jgi:hypothetical protein
MCRLENLTKLDLLNCRNLQNIDGVSNLTKLTKLNLQDCRSIQNVDELSI